MPTHPNESPSSPSLLNDCDNCLRVDVNQCAEILVFNLGLKEGTDYDFSFIDNHGKKHIVRATGLADGSAIINTSDLPLGFLIVYAGVKTVTIREVGSCDDLCFNSCANKVEFFCCIILTPVDTTGDIDDPISVEIPCCKGKESLVLLSLTIVCNDPLDGGGVASLSGTVINGSGSYELQVNYGGGWETVEIFSSVTSGSILNDFNIPKTPPEPLSIQVRIIDTISGLTSNVITIIVPSCNPIIEESIDFLNVYFKCKTNKYAEISGSFNVVDGSGSYDFQMYAGGVWNTIATNIPSPFTTQIFAGVDSEGEFPARIIDSATGAVSNELIVYGENCGGSVKSISILSASSSCEGEQQDESVQIEINYDGTGHTFELQYYDGASWITIGTTLGVGQTQFYVIAYNSGVPAGGYLIRVNDTTQGIYSVTQNLNFVDCATSAIFLDGVQLGEENNLSHIYSTDNVYEYSYSLFDLVREYSTDNVFFDTIANSLGWLGSNPDTASHQNTASNIHYSAGNFVRLVGKDSGGGLVYSNSLQIVTSPKVSKADPYCFANQNGVTIGGLVDAGYFQNYIIEYRLAGSGDPYTVLGVYNATSGTFGDFNVPIGAGNEFANTSLDIRLRSDVNAWIFSPDFTVTLSPPC